MQRLNQLRLLAGLGLALTACAGPPAPEEGHARQPG